MKKSLDKHIRMGYGSDPENPRPRKACAGFAFMAGAPSQANGVPSANEGQSAGRPFPENRMSESRVQMYAAELAEEVNREWGTTWSFVPGNAVLRYFGDFSGVDFTPCQQIKLDPPKTKREAKPAINLSEAGEKYRGIGWCDAT